MMVEKDSLSLKLEVKNVRKIEQKSLKIQFDVVFLEIGLTIKEFRLFQTNDTFWTSVPTRVYEVNGEKKYAPLIWFESDEKRVKTLEKITKLAEKAYFGQIQAEYMTTPTDGDEEKTPF